MVENLDYVHTDLKRHRRFLNVLVPFVAYGAVKRYSPLLFSKGWESTLIPKMDQAKFAELLLKHKAEICLGVPGYFDSAMEDKAFQEADLGQAVSYIVGGDALKQEKEFRLDDFLVSRGGRVIKKGYGLTECAAAATVSSDIINSIGSVGIPLHSRALRFLFRKLRFLLLIWIQEKKRVMGNLVSFVLRVLLS